MSGATQDDLLAAWRRLARSAFPVAGEKVAKHRPGAVTDDEWSRYVEMLVRPLAELVRRLRPVVVGISGPPGSGKSTLARVVEAVLDVPAPGSLVLSMDDFYLSRSERASRGLRWRGGPGSHDLALLEHVLDAIQAGRAPITVPRFSARTDDRAGIDTLPVAPALVFLEGWFLGYGEEGYGEILRYLDVLVFLDVDVETARGRRFLREELLRESGGGFTEEQTQAFWDEVLAPGLERLVPSARRSADIVLSIGTDQDVLGVTAWSPAVQEALR